MLASALRPNSPEWPVETPALRDKGRDLPGSNTPYTISLAAREKVHSRKLAAWKPSIQSTLAGNASKDEEQLNRSQGSGCTTKIKMVYYQKERLGFGLWIEYWPGMHEAPGSICRYGVHICNLSTWEEEARGSSSSPVL